MGLLQLGDASKQRNNTRSSSKRRRQSLPVQLVPCAEAVCDENDAAYEPYVPGNDSYNGEPYEPYCEPSYEPFYEPVKRDPRRRRSTSDLPSATAASLR